MTATLHSEINFLSHKIYDEILRELQLGFRKDGQPTKLDVTTRLALLDEYTNDLEGHLSGKTDEQLQERIAGLEAFYNRVSAEIV